MSALAKGETVRVRSVQGVRLRRAILALVLMGVVIFGGGALLRLAEWGIALDASSGAGAPENIREIFVKEVLALDGYENVQMNADGSVVGFSMAHSAQNAFDEIVAILETQGWRSVPSGSGVEGSFVKLSGRYVWAYVSCIQIGDSTSVVVQCATNSGKERNE